MNINRDYLEAASLVFIRKARFVEGYDAYEDLKGIIDKFASNEYNTTCIEDQMPLLKKYIIETDSIGLIILGSNINNSKKYNKLSIDRNINEYQHIEKVCSLLLKDYFSKEEIKSCCFKTPNFNVYYKPN